MITLNKGITQLLWILCLTGAGGCYASTIYGTPAALAGSRAEDSGQIITGGGYNTDDGNFTLTWNGIYPKSETCSPTGTMSADTKIPGLSDFIISLSEGCSL